MLSQTFIFLIAATATASEVREGVYRQVHEVNVSTFSAEGQCEAEGGLWGGADQTCAILTADTIELRLKENGRRELHVQTMSDNGARCDFVSDRVRETDAHSLIAISDVGESDGPGTQTTKSSCEVKIHFFKGGSARAFATDSCRYYCGVGASLDIRDASLAALPE